MAEKVEIDIPGIGKIEAKNAASEKTLQDILKALQGKPANANGGAPAGGGGGGGAGVGAGGKSANNALNAVSKSGSNVAAGLGKLAKGFGGVAAGAAMAVTAFADLSGKLSGMLGGMANMGDSLEAAANQIPLFGKFFGPIAAATEKATSAFQAATASGSTFGNSVNGLASAASAAGMTMEKYAALVAKNGEAMKFLGGNTEDGANRFAQLGAQMKKSSFMGSLNNLGYTTEEVNDGMASYIKNLGMQNKLSGKSNADLVAGTATYLKEMDQLAKITGETRKQQEDARAKLMNDAQYQAKVANMGEKAGAAFANTINGLPGPLRDVAKDIMVTGTATTEEAQKFSATMPKSAELMRKYAEITNAGGTITQSMQNQLQETMRMEGKAAKEQYADQGKYNKEMAGTYMQYVAAANIQKDAVNGAAKAQENAAKKTDGLAAATEANKRAVAEVSNSFTMLLANSGMMDAMMKAFGLVVKFMENVVVPAFKIVGKVVSWLVDALSTPIGQVVAVIGGVIAAFTTIWPIITGIGTAITSMGSILMGAGTALAGALAAVTWPIWAVVGAAVALWAIMDHFGLDLQYIGEWIQDKFLRAFYAVSDWINDTFRPVINFFSRMLADASTYIDKMADGFNDVKNWITTQFLNGFKDVRDWFNTVFMEPFKSIVDVLKQTFQPAIDAVATKFTYLKGKFDEWTSAAADLFRGFNKISEVGEFLSIKFKDLMLTLRKYELYLEEKITITSSGKEDLAKRQAALAEEEMANKTRAADLEARMQKNREANVETEKKQIAEAQADRKKRDDSLDARKKKSEDDLAKRNEEREKKKLDSVSGAAATAGSEAAAKAVECAGIDYSSPEAMFKSFQETLGGSGAKDAKKKELADAQVEAEKKLKAAKTPEEKKAAEDVLAKIKADQERVSKTSPGYADVKTSGKYGKDAAEAYIKPVATKDNEASKKEIEAKAEKEKADKAAAEKAAAERNGKTETGPKTGQQPGQQQPAQESAEVLLARLNTSVTELVRINKQAVDVHEQQLRVQKSLSGDVYSSPVAYT
jgi:hypothetical protein